MEDPLSDNECIICFELIKQTDQIGQLPCCPTKLYHRECIEIWSSKANSCPTCRNNYYRVNISVASAPAKIVEVIRVQDRILPNPAINEIPEQFIDLISDVRAQRQQEQLLPTETTTSFCAICSTTRRSSADQSISCYQCGSNFHLYCLGVGQLEQDSLQWDCPMCDYSQESLIPRRRRGVIRSIMASSSRHYQPHARASSSSSTTTRSTLHRPGGLVIFNENNEIDDAFLYEDEEEEEEERGVEEPTFEPELRFLQQQQQQQQSSFDRASPRVMNGGTLLRREKRQEESLTQEEVNSWACFDKVKCKSGNLTAGGSAFRNLESTASTSASSNFVRKKRRKRSIEQSSAMESSSASTTTTTPVVQPRIVQSNIPQPSRIANLINELKTNKKPTPSTLTSSHFSTNFSAFHQHSSPTSESNSTSLANSPMDINYSSSDDNEYTVATTTNTSATTTTTATAASTSTATATIASAPRPRRDQLSYNEKSIIQKHLRANLKSRYKPGVIEDGVISNEEEFIEINKNISRRIYGHILNSSCDVEEIFKDERKLRAIIDEYASNSI
ncbi:uncharacterized protein LODBEIA_P25030 [Lodderomyces beijingensis]|uniref:PHD-type domain-containing protein n=1 Tax=Lodderomyces beijingensis TaxID=1775926 RepID=A0ABP0ZJF6_9ASCO